MITILAVGLVAPTASAAVATEASPATLFSPGVPASTPLASGSSSYSEAVLADHPTVYYRLDENEGPTAHDSSGNELNGAYGPGVEYGLSGALVGESDTAVADRDNQSGLGGVVVQQAGDRLPAGNSPRTLETWIKAQGGSEGAPLLEYGDVSGGHGVRITATGPCCGASATGFAVSDGSASVGATPLGPNNGVETGVWHLLDITYDGSTAEIYLDGQIIGAGQLGKAETVTPGQGLKLRALGCCGTQSGLDEVAIYPTALSPERIDAHWSVGQTEPGASACAAVPSGGYPSSVLADSPSAYYRLDELAAHPDRRLALDSSPHCSNATYVESPPATKSIPGALASESDTAFGSGSCQSTQCPVLRQTGDKLPSGNSPRTLEMWLRAQGGSEGETLLEYGDVAGGHGIRIRTIGPCCGGAANGFAVSDGSTSVGASPSGPDNAVETGMWHLLDITYDGSMAEIYLDGQVIGGGPLGNAETVTPGDGLNVRSLGCCGNPYGLDEVAIYPSALSPERIDAHWTAGQTEHGVSECASAPSGIYASAVLANSPDAYYRLNELAAHPEGRVAFDSSPHCANGAYAGPVKSAPGALLTETDTAAGSTDNGSVMVSQSGDQLPTGNSPRTLEEWIAPGGQSENSSCEALLEYGDVAGGHGVTLCAVTTGDHISGFKAIVGTGSVGGGASWPGGWHLLDATYDGSTVAIYFDGQLVGRGHLGNAETILPGQGLHIRAPGCCGSSSQFDEVAIYPSALSPEAIDAHWTKGRLEPGQSACAPAPTGLYPSAVLAGSPDAYYRLDELAAYPADPVAFDSSPHCANATYAPAGLTSAPGALVGDSDTALSSAASGADMLTQSGDQLPAGNSPRTLEEWILPRGASENATCEPLIEYGDVAGGHGVMVCTGTTELTITSFRVIIGGKTVGAPVHWTSDWHLLDVTYDGNRVKVYLDGALLGGGEVGDAETVTPGQGLQVRATGCCGYPFWLDDVAIYPEALSPGAIAGHEDASGRNPPTDGPPTAAELYGGGAFCLPCLMKSLIHAFIGEPVDAEDGNMYHTFNDLQIPDRGLPLAFTRTYNSLAASTNGPLGHGWVDNLGANLAVSGSTAVLTEENGAQTTFTFNGSTWSAPPRDIATLTHNEDGTWTVVRHAQQTLRFNSAGQLTSMSDLDGNRLSYSYSEGHVTEVADGAGRKLILGYSGGHIASVTDPNVTPNRVVEFKYDEAGDLTEVIDAGGGHTQFSYDSAHRMLTMKDPKCVATEGCPGIQNVYNEQGRVKEQRDELERKTTFAYEGEPASAAGGATTITDPKGNVTVDHYEYGLKVSETRGAGTGRAATTSYVYDPATLQPVSIIDPNGHPTTMTYDASGNMLSRTDALGRETTYTYNAFNEPLTEEDPMHVKTTMTYDARGNLESRERPLEGTAEVQKTTYHYEDTEHAGDLTAMTDPEAHTWHYAYDGYGDRTLSEDPLHHKTTSTYNADGWLLTTTTPRGNVEGADPAKFTTTYKHNSFGEVTETVDPLAHKTTDEYDPDQNLVASTDANHNETKYSYNAADEQTAVHHADGTTLETTYWPDGTVKEQIDGAHHATFYEYDPLGRVSAVTDPLVRTTRYGYDPAGNRTTVTDPEHRVTTTSYDAANEPTGTSYTDGKTPNVTGVTYNADGERTGMTDGTGTWEWIWDSLHRLTNVKEGSNGTVRYKYDLRRDLTEIVYPNGKAVMRGYDDAGRWTGVKDWLGNETKFGYDPNGNLTTETLPAEAGITDTFAYANDDTLSATEDKRGATALFTASYARDANRQLTGDSSLPAAEGSYGYTALNQLCYQGGSAGASCSTPPTGATAYQYDSADNLTQMGRVTQTFDAADELTGASASTTSTTTTTTSTPPPTTTTTETTTTSTSTTSTSSTTPSSTTTTTSSTTTKHKEHKEHKEHSHAAITSGTVGFGHSTHKGRTISRAISTSGPGDLVLAFVSAQGPRSGGQGVASISRRRIVAAVGGGLRWRLVTEKSGPGGYVGIWQARARKPLHDAHVKVTLRKAGFPASLAVVGFDSKALVVGQDVAGGRSTAPQVAVMVPPNAVVWAIGEDAAHHAKLKPGAGGELLSTADPVHGDTSWLQSDTPSAAGRVLAADSTAESSAWILATVTIREHAAGASRVARRYSPTLSVTLDAPGPIRAGMPFATQAALTTASVSASPAPTTADGTLTYWYDEEGDRSVVSASNGASQTYSYNQALELTGIGSEVSYTYNGDGLRMSKTVRGITAPFASDVTGSVPTLLEDGANAYIYGPDGLPLEQVHGATPLWFHHDQLGSTRLLTDATGDTVATYSYSPYGALASSSGAASTPLLFAGQHQDAESGLYYLGARYYDPATANFISKDPAVATTHQPYQYVAGNPLNATDPTGMMCGLWGDAAFWSSGCQIDLPGGNCIANGAPGCSGGDTGFSNFQDNVSDPNPTGFIAVVRDLSAPVALGSDIGRSLKCGGNVSLEDWASVPLDLIPGGSSVLKGMGIGTRLAIHDAHHVFDGLGALPHIQLNWWKIGVKGSGGAFRIPLPNIWPFK